MDERLLLTSDELVRITGCKRAKDQIEYIRRKYGVIAHINAANEAVVLRCHLERADQLAPQAESRPKSRVRQVA